MPATCKNFIGLLLAAPGMQIFYSDTFELPLPPGHRFPASKYRVVRERLQNGGCASRFSFHPAPRATDEQLLRVHTRSYLEKLETGRLSAVEQRRIGFPWSREMVERSRRSTGATLAAARAALAEGAAAHLAGGTHHAFPDHGQGFCVFNDVAVAICTLQAEEKIKHAVVIDLDVHQGNGTAAIFAKDDAVFTFSMHGADNFPFTKQGSDLDIALPNGAEDRAFLGALGSALREQLPLAQADMAFYLAGADPFVGDKYGKLRLTKDGLRARDLAVYHACSHLPLVVVMAGGYAPVEDIADIYEQTVLELSKTRGALVRA